MQKLIEGIIINSVHRGFPGWDPHSNIISHYTARIRHESGICSNHESWLVYSSWVALQAGSHPGGGRSPLTPPPQVSGWWPSAHWPALPLTSMEPNWCSQNASELKELTRCPPRNLPNECSFFFFFTIYLNQSFSATPLLTYGANHSLLGASWALQDV